MSKENEQEKNSENEENTPEDIEKLEKENAELNENLNNVVEEIKEMRKKNQDVTAKNKELEELLEQSAKKNQEVAEAGGDSPDIRSEIEKVLREKEASRSKDNKKVALERFMREHKEFHPDNDISGLRLDALERKLSTFNTKDVVSEEDWYSRIEDAHKLLGSKDTADETSKDEDVENPYASTKKSNPSPKGEPENKLTPREKEVIEQNGWTEERYLKLKESQPHVVARLLKSS